MKTFNNDEKKLAKIVSKLPPKLAACIELEKQANIHIAEPEIVSIDSFKGQPGLEKTRGHYYFGQSVPMRFVYQKTSVCSYSDTYSGEVYLPIGKGKYLKLVVFG